MHCHFIVGCKDEGKTNRISVEAADALAAALIVRNERPDAVIMYVRPENRRGDARHPAQAWIDKD